MQNRFFFFVLFTGLFILSTTGFGQTPSTSVKPSVVTGEVVSISATNISLKTDAGEIAVQVIESTEIKRVPPETPKLSAAVAASIGDIGVGDKLLVTGIFPDDRTTLPARAVYLMTKSDIAQKQASERQKWSTRGISGRVVSVDSDKNQIQIEVRGLVGSSNVTITPKDDAIFRRYAPNSVKYSQAIVGSIANVQAGDMLRALGDRSPDGVVFTAEEILTGATQTVAGIVKSVDVDANEVTITNHQTDADVVIDLGKASLMKRFPEEMARRMALMGSGGAGAPARGGEDAAAGAAARPGSGQAPGVGQPGNGTGRLGRGGIDEMLGRFPDITAAELKPGDMIAVSSTRSDDAQRITAIKLLAGVEPFIRAAQMSGNLQRGGRGGQGGAFTIPGLEDPEFP